MCAKNWFKWSICALVTGLIFLIAGCVLIPVFHNVIHEEIKEQIPLKEGSTTFNTWKEPALPIYFQIYVFDLENPMEVVQNGAKPALRQKGPYTYRFQNYLLYRQLGVPGRMRWPVKVISEDDEGTVEVYCQSDNAIFLLTKDKVEPFENGSKWEEKAQNCLAKKKETMQCFLSDLQLARLKVTGQVDEQEEDSDEHMDKRENRVDNPRLNPADEQMDEQDSVNEHRQIIFDEQIVEQGKGTVYEERHNAAVEQGKDTVDEQRQTPADEQMDEQGKDMADEQRQTPADEQMDEQGKDMADEQRQTPADEQMDEQGKDMADEQRQTPADEQMDEQGKDMADEQRQTPADEQMDEQGKDTADEQRQTPADEQMDRVHEYLEQRKNTFDEQRQITADEQMGENVKNTVDEKRQTPAEEQMDEQGKDTFDEQRQTTFDEQMDDQGKDNLDEQKQTPADEQMAEQGKDTFDEQRQMPTDEQMDEWGKGTVDEQRQTPADGKIDEQIDQQEKDTVDEKRHNSADEQMAEQGKSTVEQRPVRADEQIGINGKEIVDEQMDQDGRVHECGEQTKDTFYEQRPITADEQMGENVKNTLDEQRQTPADEQRQKTADGQMVEQRKDTVDEQRDKDFEYVSDSENEFQEDLENDDSVKDPDYVNDDDDKTSDDDISDNGYDDAMSEVLELNTPGDNDMGSAANDIQLLQNIEVEEVDSVQDEDKQEDSNVSCDDSTDEYTLDELPKKRKKQLPETEFLFDEKYPKVFIKKLKKQNDKSKHNRVYDCVHACLFCHELFSNIQSHLEKHSNRIQVKEIKELKSTISQEVDKEKLKGLSRKLSDKMTLLRNKGNNLHNRKVLKHKEGELLLAKRKEGIFQLSEYGPCPNCAEWIVLKCSITNHQKTCPAKDESAYHKGTTMIQVGMITGSLIHTGSKLLHKEVFPSMQKDDIATMAMQDPLILALGDIWLKKNIDNKRRRKYYATYHMRLAAKLLQAFKTTSEKPDSAVYEMLIPSNFDKIAENALQICAKNVDNKLKDLHDTELDYPSTALKLGFDITRMASAKLGLSIKTGDEKGKQEATDFMHLMKMEWGTKVSKLARVTLSERQFNKRKELPHPEDIVKFSTYLIKEIKALDLNQATTDAEKFRKAVMLVEARLIMYNRRRPGELEALSLEYYRNRSTSVTETDLSLRQQLSFLEKKMIQSQELIEIRGKNGTRVPVICPEEVILAMQYLADPQTRKKAGIKDENMYLFANTALDVVRAGNSIEELRSQCGLKFPSRIHATNLRKHCATIAQVIGLKDHELKYLCRHLGHTMQVHETHYRATSGLIERLDIAKLMLIQEGNLVAKFQGKALTDITFEEILQNEESPSSVSSSQEEVESTEDMDIDMDIEDDGDNNILSSRKRPKKSTRKAWTKEEMEELLKYFPEYLRGNPKRSCPTRNDCLRAIKDSEDNGGVLHKRHWETIKKKVHNSIKKN